MFDIGISEIAVIAVVALVVIGPERLPKVARTIGTLMGRAQRYVNDVKAEVNREMELEELRKLQTQMQDAARSIQEQVSSAGAEMQSTMHEVEKQLHDGAAPPSPPVSDPAAYIPTPLAEPPPDVPAPGVAVSTESTPLHADASQPQAGSSHGDADGLADATDKPTQTSLFPEHTVR